MFCNLGITDIFYQINFVLGHAVGGGDRGGCPVHCGVFSSIPNLHLLEASCTYPVVAANSGSTYCQISS